MRVTGWRAIGLALVCGIAALAALAHRSDAARGARLGAIASEIARRPVSVGCPGFWKRLVDVSANQGTVGVDERGRVGDRADLSVEICGDLDRIANGDVDEALACLAAPTPSCEPRLDRIAFALDALARESYHLAGIVDESLAECYAMQTIALVGERLGLPRGHGEALAAYYFRREYPRLPHEYRSAICRPWGPLDIHPETAAWPA